MKENKEKSEKKNSLLEWYNEIPRKKRNKFILALQLKFDMSAQGIYDKIKKDNWKPYQREMIDEVVNEGLWEK
mgnify:FL=1|jgi:hypothetical protein